MKSVFGLSFMLICSVISAQFTGGSGDGFSSVSVDFTNTSMVSTSVFELPKTVFGKGEVVSLTMDQLELISVSTSRRYLLSKINSGFVIPENVSSGFYVLVLTNENFMMRRKIYVEE